MIRCFDADWARKPFKPDPKSHLIWCPNNGRERIAHVIDRAKKSLWLQNERYQDTVIIERIVRAVSRGVRVRVMARPAHKLSGKKLAEGFGGLRILHDVGAKVHLLKGLKLHGKIVIADGKQAIVGSINLSPGSFDSRRELAITTKSKHVLKRLVQVSRRDWKHSRRIDLSDEGILADLEKHGSKGADVLVLRPSHT
jgi:cardiolipin synthase A/B